MNHANHWHVLWKTFGQQLGEGNKYLPKRYHHCSTLLFRQEWIKLNLNANRPWRVVFTSPAIRSGGVIFLYSPSSQLQAHNNCSLNIHSSTVKMFTWLHTECPPAHNSLKNTETSNLDQTQPLHFPVLSLVCQRHVRALWRKGQLRKEPPQYCPIIYQSVF